MSGEQPLTAMGRFCAAHHHREMVPIEKHHIFPLGDGGPDTAANKIQVCANAHSSIHYLIDLCRKYGDYKLVPYEQRRTFGLKVRNLAFQGWLQIKAAQENAS